MMIELEPTQVTVREGLERYRKDMGEIKELAESILCSGQLQPIIINGEKELIAGGRRLAACIFAGIRVKAIYRKDVTDPDTMRELEIIENLERKAFTPAEEQVAIADYHKIMLRKYGEDPALASNRSNLSASGDGKKKWDATKTAEKLGLSQASISNALRDAQALKENPELAKAKTKGEIRNKAKKLEAFEKAYAAAEAAKKRREAELQKLKSEEDKKKKQLKFTCECVSAESFLASIEKDSVDLVITDPPYIIDVNSNRSITSEIDGYDDTPENNVYFIEKFVSDLVRTLNPTTGQVYMFIGSEWFQHFRQQFEANGMVAYWKEIIWIKGVSGQTNRPDMWPADCYEKILYARMAQSRLVKEGMPNWIQCDPIRNKQHQAEKPEALIANLLLRSAIPNQFFIDPCCGSGNIACAALKHGMYVKCADIAEKWAAYASAKLLSI